MIGGDVFQGVPLEALAEFPPAWVDTVRAGAWSRTQVFQKHEAGGSWGDLHLQLWPANSEHDGVCQALRLGARAGKTRYSRKVCSWQSGFWYPACLCN